MQENKLCYNCLRRGHRVYEYKSKILCYECGRRHHTLLHIEQVTSEVSNRTETEPGSMQGGLADDRTSVVSASTSLKKSSKKRGSVKQTIFKIVQVKVGTMFQLNTSALMPLLMKDRASIFVQLIWRNAWEYLLTTEMLSEKTTNAVTTIKQKVQDLAVKGLKKAQRFKLKMH